ncbi:MAG: DUF2796 domain-containing protein [Pseudomonadota bacterium]
MRTALTLLASTLLAVPALAEEARQLGAHEHGVGALNIAIDGGSVAIEFRAPGADIVGFEYEATSAEDRAAIDAAVAQLAKPLDLFVLPAAAACSVTQASATLVSDDDHDHGEEAHDAQAHDDHAHDDHGHDDHAHDDHAHDDHAHGDHGHDEAADARHTEFHADYTLTCGEPSAIDQITFAYFEMFENALELEVQVVSDSGAQAFEVLREAPVLDLRGMF